ncbi:hypothetical protein CEXT_357561 [Caerostris extrusa]|uniref:Uncharacterized protein n=1 Tax=Caerostris extrusa TaxID=172846 RepID=A0AAV4NS25_CAEEX|nr:hypothetical protein CEXT_357561 [Caerostris extrusa]
MILIRERDLVKQLAVVGKVLALRENNCNPGYTAGQYLNKTFHTGGEYVPCRVPLAPKQEAAYLVDLFGG